MKVLASTLIGMVVLLVMEERTWGAHERVAVRRQPDQAAVKTTSKVTSVSTSFSGPSRREPRALPVP